VEKIKLRTPLVLNVLFLQHFAGILIISSVLIRLFPPADGVGRISYGYRFYSVIFIRTLYHACIYTRRWNGTN